MAALAAGQRAPALTLKTADGTVVRLSDFLGKQVVLYFYPKVRVDGHLEEVLAALAAATPADGSRSAPARSGAH